MITDFLVLALSVFGAQWLRLGLTGATLKIEYYEQSVWRVPYPLVSAVIVLVWMFALATSHSRDSQIIGIGTPEYERVTSATFLVFGMVALACLMVRMEPARLYLLGAMVCGLFLLLVERWSWRQWLTAQRVRGEFLHRVVLVGDDQSAGHVAGEIESHPAIGFEVVKTVLLDPEGKIVEGGGAQSLIDAITSCDADTVIYTGSNGHTPEELREFGWQLQRRAITLIVTPAVIDFVGPRIHMRRAAGLPLVYAEYPEFRYGQRVLKRGMDVAISSVALVLLSPLFLVLTIMIKTGSPGPVLFSQRRVGRYGKTFKMYKFRSMVVGAEGQLGSLLDRSDGNKVLFKMRDDPRVTKVGRWMRRYSIDELPQLVNVLANHMSLVGPRPPLESEVAKYSRRDRRRLLVKPGMTGLWQVNGRSNLGWDDSIRMDLQYIENWSMLGDIMILVRTIRAVWRHEGAY
jgi:exopolysaccharide biosynthesis polyprenyl glycosylphosphotransferase